MNILMGDDNPKIRERVIRLFSDRSEEFCFQEAANSEEILGLVNSSKVDLLIMDVNMPGMNGLETLKIIKMNKSGLPVIVFSLLPSEQYEKFALRSGASAYIEKTNEEELLMTVSSLLGMGGSSGFSGVSQEEMSYKQLQ